MGRSCSDAWKALVSLTLRAVGGAFVPADLWVRECPEATFEPVRWVECLAGGFVVELFFFEFFWAVAELPDGMPEAPAA